MAQRRQYSGQFKAKIVLQALKGHKTINEIASAHGVHPVQLTQWKKQALEELPQVFADRRGREARAMEEEKSRLYEEVGRLKVELDWLKKNWAVSSNLRRGWIERGHPELSVKWQCELVGVVRSSVYYEPEDESEYNLELMRLLDEQYTRTPFYGARRMIHWLRTQGHGVNHKRVERLMELMGIEAIYPRRRLSRPAPGHRLYPYLLRGLKIRRVDQIWTTDITYIRMQRGFAYLVAVLDWFSRYVLSWELSPTLGTGFCLRALERALWGSSPQIFNTGQGSQFTSEAFTDRLEKAGVAISMDGRGRALDNVSVERLWRTVKYEEVYLKDYAGFRDMTDQLGRYFRFYNGERPHQALGYRTPETVYRAAA